MTMPDELPPETTPEWTAELAAADAQDRAILVADHVLRFWVPVPDSYDVAKAARKILEDAGQPVPARCVLPASVPNTGTALSEEERALVEVVRRNPFDSQETSLVAIIDRLSSAPSRGSDSDEQDDTQRLDWMQNRVDGTGEAMQFGGVCYWGIEIVKGPRSKPKRIGEGDDLRDAIDDAIANEAARLIATAPSTPLVTESAGGTNG
jgi:hypothetical protein